MTNFFIWCDLQEKINYTIAATAPTKMTKDVDIKFVPGSMIKNFGSLKCSGGGQKAAKGGKDEEKAKTPKRKATSDVDGRSLHDSPPVKVGRTKAEAMRVS